MHKREKERERENRLQWKKNTMQHIEKIHYHNDDDNGF